MFEKLKINCNDEIKKLIIKLNIKLNIKINLKIKKLNNKIIK